VDFTIDTELRDLIPPLTDDERERLEASIGSEGVRNPLVVWKEAGVLVDGHHRHEIATRLGLDYDTVARSFADRAAAELWMIENQLGTRNLSPDQYRWLKGQRYNRVKKARGGTGANQHQQSGHFDRSAKTAAKLADRESERTVRRWAKDVEEIERASKEPDAPEEVRELPKQVAGGKTTLRQAKEQAGLIPKKISDPAAVARRKGRPGIVTVQVDKTPEGFMRVIRKHLTRDDIAVLGQRIAMHLEGD